MDLSVSPDLDVYWCYLIVVVLGAVTAVIQISSRLSNVTGAWRVWQTWLLFILYLAVPVGLFWLLDRTSAISDSSFFAAILVGAGYVGIMSGKSQTINPPSAVSSWWTPFLAYTDKISAAVLKRTTVNRARLIDRIVTSIIEERERYEALESLGLRFSSDPVQLSKQLAAIESAANARKPSEASENGATSTDKDISNEVLEDKTRRLFTEIANTPDIYYLMKARNIITPRVYWLFVRGGRTIIASGLALIITLPILVAIILWLRLDYGNLHADYYLWRLGKTNGTMTDQNRTRSALVALMQTPEIEGVVTDKLASMLRSPNLPIERANLILQTLLESRTQLGGNQTLPVKMVPSLRSTSVDIRARVNDVLRYLANQCRDKFDEGSPWKPNDGDFTTVLEDRIRKWKDFWSKPCVPAL